MYSILLGIFSELGNDCGKEASVHSMAVRLVQVSWWGVVGAQQEMGGGGGGDVGGWGEKHAQKNENRN